MGERGLLATARRFVDRTFGMKAPPAFAAEPAATDGLFDFSSTTGTRMVAVLSGEGATPFVGAWLRERVAGGAPTAFVARPMDENTWNACAATALGRAFVISTDERFFDATRPSWPSCGAPRGRRPGPRARLQRGDLRHLLLRAGRGPLVKV